MSESKIIENVFDVYERNIQKAVDKNVHDSKGYKHEFEKDRRRARALLRKGDIEGAVSVTIEMFNYLDENDMLSGRIRYPGPTAGFKRLAAKYE